ncbi:exonuclease SbcCD, C subunit [Actinomyces graevenitzii F0530]|uniref:Nuclease SbcCD subunit C n=1 Tax=Actinomyces graevenitzii F0530 TaxID=1321817 RepID=U1QFW6_9ACTO|nr:SMC family ATPase [Actinomyces graevenitzii]ERH20784.1 exonuclease SbcCD, C subunit [Actinomyces graevenitzii F0530]
MRILRLTMDAVGPFPGHEVIDFEAFSDAGRFLLSGPTGAGKSTIIDAIVFALYGKVSGGRDSSDSRIRSRYASEQAKTEVELIFSTSSGNYKVRRQPAYERVKKNGKGVTKQNAKAWLFKLDEQLREVSEPLTKTSDVGTEITRIVGLSREQFTQTVVLPQGKFAQFLRSTSKDRQDLLQELFGTAIFEDLQLDLVERARKVKKNQEALDATLRANLGVLASLLDEAPQLNQERSLVYEPVPEVDCEFDPLETAWDSRFKPLTPWLEHNQRCANLEVSALREQEDKLRSEFTSQRDLAARQERYLALTKEHEQLVAQGPAQVQRLAQIQALQALSDLKPWHEQLKQAQDQQAVAQRQLSQALELEQLESDERVQAVLQQSGDYQGAQALSVQLTAQVAALNPQVELEAGLAGRRRDLQTKTQAHESASAKLAQGRERENQLPTQIASQQELLEQLNEQAATLPTAQLAQEQAAQTLKLAKAHEQLVEDQQQALKLQQLVALELKQASQRHKHMLEQWLSQSALNLAQNLVAGEPCPVCGATEHPAPATQGGENISQEQLDQALEKVNEVQGELSQASKRVTKLAAQLEAQPCQLSPAQAREQLQEAKAALTAAQQASEQASSCKAQIAKLNAQLEALRADNQTAQARLAGDAKEIQLLGEKIESDAASLSCEGFESVAAKVEYLSQLTAGLEQLANAAQELDQCKKRAQQAADSFAAQWAQASAKFAELDSAKPAVPAPTDPVETEPTQAEPTQDTSAANVQDGYAQACQAFAGLDLAALKATSASYEKSLSINQAALAELEGIELTPPPLEQIQAQLEQAQAKTQACQTYASTWQAFAGQVNAQLAKLNELLARRSKASAKDGQLLALASAANGDNQARLTLSAWVLQAHFRQVLVFANERLGVIGAGRYELINVDSEEDTRQQKQGLGLAVVDHLSGTTRSPRTLSGGESFYVSLALALALADVVATQNGGIEMNTLFIDEGFGSLDEGTLAEVMDVLGALHSGGRVVGIVSHVSELKRAIPAAVEVRPLLGGGSTLRTRV